MGCTLTPALWLLVGSASGRQQEQRLGAEQGQGPAPQVPYRVTKGQQVPPPKATAPEGPLPRAPWCDLPMSCLLLVHRSPDGFCILILYLVASLNTPITYYNMFVDSLRL